MGGGDASSQTVWHSMNPFGLPAQLVKQSPPGPPELLPPPPQPDPGEQEAPWVQPVGGDEQPVVHWKWPVPSHMQDVSQFSTDPSGTGVAVPQPVPGLQVAPCEQSPDGGGDIGGGQGNSSTHSWFESTYWPPTLVPSGHTRARSGSSRREQSGSAVPPLLELLLVGPLLDPTDPLLLEPDEPTLPGPERAPPPPHPEPRRSARPIQPRDRLARAAGRRLRDRRPRRENRM